MYYRNLKNICFSFIVLTPDITGWSQQQCYMLIFPLVLNVAQFLLVNIKSWNVIRNLLSVNKKAVKYSCKSCHKTFSPCVSFFGMFSQDLFAITWLCQYLRFICLNTMQQVTVSCTHTDSPHSLCTKCDMISVTQWSCVPPSSVQW